MQSLINHPHLNRVFKTWRSMRVDDDIPGISAMMLDRMPETLRNVTITEMRGSDIVMRYHGDDLRSRAGASLAGASYFDLIPEREWPRWNRAIRAMLDTPCALAGVLLTHTREATLEGGVLALPFRGQDGTVSHFLSAIANISRSAPKHDRSSGMPFPWLEIDQIEALDIGFDVPDLEL